MELHLVIGGPLAGSGISALGPDNTEVVGLFSDYSKAVDAWRGAAQRTIDDAEMRFVILPLHRLIPPMLGPETIAA